MTFTEYVYQNCVDDYPDIEEGMSLDDFLEITDLQEQDVQDLAEDYISELGSDDPIWDMEGFEFQRD